MIPVKVDPVKAMKLVVAAVLVGAIVLGEVLLYRKGYSAGEASKLAELTKVQGDLSLANSQIEVLSKKLDTQNAAIEEAKRKAEEAKISARVAEAEAKNIKKASDAEASDWQRRLLEAKSSPECAVLNMPLCPNVMDY